MDKYQARQNNKNYNQPEKTKAEKTKQAGKKAFKAGAKFVADKYLPGVGGKLVDAIGNTPIGKNIIEQGGKMATQNPLVGSLLRKADESGALNVAEKATDTTSSNPKDNSKSLPNESNQETTTQKTNTKDKSSLPLSNLFGTGTEAKKSIFSLIGKKYLIIGAAGGFLFLLLIAAIMGAKDFGNLDITNKSEAMGSYVPESIEAVSPGDIGSVSEATMDGNNTEIIGNGNTLKDKIGEEGLNLLNQQIATSVQSAGYGTGAAAAAAAQTLIQSLANNNITLPYFWGGGHGRISTGANAEWGKYTKVTAGGHSTSFSNQPLGLDCSGFVSWALYNGGCKNFTPITAAQFKNLGPSTTFQQAKTGDIAATTSHVVLILENKGDKLLVAEAKGSAYGVIFTERSKKDLNNYKIVNMSEYYQTNCG